MILLPEDARDIWQCDSWLIVEKRISQLEKLYSLCQRRKRKKQRKEHKNFCINMSTLRAA